MTLPTAIENKVIHHLVYIHPLKYLSPLYYMGCGRKFFLKDKGLLNCSHIEMVTCKQCLREYKNRGVDNDR